MPAPGDALGIRRRAGFGFVSRQADPASPNLNEPVCGQRLGRLVVEAALRRGRSATRVSVRARRCLNEPSNGSACAAARSGGLGKDIARQAGTLSQRGIRARQTVAPRSISACAEAGPNSPPVRSSTRRTFVSTGRTGRSKANRATASAVYRPTPGSSVRSSGQPSAAILAARRGAG